MTLTKILWAGMLSSVTLTGFACENPPLVQIPKAADLKDREQQKVREEVTAYFTAMKVYTDCVQAELAAAGGDNAPPLTKSSLVVRNNGAVAEAESMMKVFTANFGALNDGPPLPQPK